MRVASLDFIRGVAVLGILAINVAGFAGPSIGTLAPNLTSPASFWDEVAFAFNFVVFEGKMRALFAMLFGASMALFIERAEAAGLNAEALQVRRLGWLLLFGALHYALLWWGDILFAYGACGVIVLLAHRLPIRLLLVGSAALFIVVHLQGLLSALPMVQAEEAVRLHHATALQTAGYDQYRTYIAEGIAREMGQYAGGFWHIAMTKLRDHPFWLLQGVRDGFGEYVPMMTLGLVLQRMGFFVGAWRKGTMLSIGLGATAAGLASTLAALMWLWRRDFPVAAMDATLRYALALPHLLMALGYAALLVLAAPALTQTVLGQRLAAAGRVAFSNYLGTSLVMTAIFYGWGLGLFGDVGALGGWAFVLLCWALMLGWSLPWLTRWRRGPLEWLWRSLAEGTWLPNRR